jgi:hypothetical protein
MIIFQITGNLMDGYLYKGQLGVTAVVKKVQIKVKKSQQQQQQKQKSRVPADELGSSAIVPINAGANAAHRNSLAESLASSTGNSNLHQPRGLTLSYSTAAPRSAEIEVTNIHVKLFQDAPYRKKKKPWANLKYSAEAHKTAFKVGLGEDKNKKVKRPTSSSSAPERDPEDDEQDLLLTKRSVSEDASEASDAASTASGGSISARRDADAIDETARIDSVVVRAKCGSWREKTVVRIMTAHYPKYYPDVTNKLAPNLYNPDI